MLETETQTQPKQAVEQPEPRYEHFMLKLDRTDAVRIDAEGKVLAIGGEPSRESPEAVARFVGIKGSAAKFRQYQLQQEMDKEINTIREKYMPRIEQYQGIINYLKGYEDVLEKLAVAMLQGKKERNTRVGRCILKLRKDAASISIVDSDKAVAFLKKTCPGAIEERTITNIVKKNFDDDVRKKLTEAPKEETGIDYYAGGSDVFTLEIDTDKLVLD